jgi:hypothetical protein
VRPVNDKPETPNAEAQPAIQVAVVDPNNAPVQYIDWIVTGGHGPSEGTVNVVLAAVDYAILTDGKPQAIIQTRLRMSVAAASNLHRFLGNILFAATQATASQSNSLN